MKISLTEAKAQLTELVRRAEGGEEVVLTRHGQPAARLLAVKPARDSRQRRAVLEAISLAGAAKAAGGPTAARSQDFLYDDEGLPG
jgi:prevent-host-death family protein